MSRKHDKKRKKNKHLRSCEHRSERRTVEFVARQIGQIQDQLCDLIPELRLFEHYSEIEDAGWCLMMLQRMKKKYQKFADTGVWEDCA